MKTKNLSEANFDLWKLMAKTHHSIILIRQKELKPHEISAEQLQVLRTVQALGSNATLSEIAKSIERKLDVISRKTALMEKDGLLRRVKTSRKSRLLRIELTERGIDMLKISRTSKSIDKVFLSLSIDERKQMETCFNKILSEADKYIPNPMK